MACGRVDVVEWNATDLGEERSEKPGPSLPMVDAREEARTEVRNPRSATRHCQFEGRLVKVGREWSKAYISILRDITLFFADEGAIRRMPFGSATVIGPSDDGILLDEDQPSDGYCYEEKIA